jgi:IMP dehydrogenase
LPSGFKSKLRDATNVFTFRDFLLLPGRSEVEPKDIDLSSKITKDITTEIPIVSSPMDTVTEWKLALSLAIVGGVGIIHRNLSIEEQVDQLKRVKNSKERVKSKDAKGRPLVGAAVSPMDTRRCLALDKVADFLVSDVAHFHNSNIIKATSRLLPSLTKDFVAGNVGTAKAVEDIITELPRVEGFRAGIGSGSICITSEVTRVGAPTLFAVAEARSALDQLGKGQTIIADGGIRSAGDATLALAAGASSVMLGSKLAGTSESPGRIVKVNGVSLKEHRGMASEAARKKRFALDRYSVPTKRLNEGVEGLVPYEGKLSDVAVGFCDGLRAAFGYSGARNITELWKVARFGLVSSQGSEELGVHGILHKEERGN